MSDLRHAVQEIRVRSLELPDPLEGPGYSPQLNLGVMAEEVVLGIQHSEADKRQIEREFDLGGRLGGLRDPAMHVVPVSKRHLQDLSKVVGIAVGVEIPPGGRTPSANPRPATERNDAEGLVACEPCRTSLL